MTMRRRSTEELKGILGRQVSMMAASGMRVESLSDFQAILVKGRRPHHLLHLIFTLMTSGLWAIVWLVLCIRGGEKRQVVWVDEFGNIVIREM